MGGRLVTLAAKEGINFKIVGKETSFMSLSVQSVTLKMTLRKRRISSRISRPRLEFMWEKHPAVSLSGLGNTGEMPAVGKKIPTWLNIGKQPTQN